MNSKDWNLYFKVGTKVKYYPIKGQKDFETTETTSEAWDLGHGASVVSINTRSGGVMLSHLERI